jgi:translocator assembly and maintenance protein 41
MATALWTQLSRAALRHSAFKPTPGAFRALASTPSVVDASALPNEHLEAVLAHFRAPVRFACGYGSGVFKQASYSADARPMLDLVFGVTHPEHWHSLNIKQNRHHYSAAAMFGSWSVAKLQDSFGAGLYYNTHVEVEGYKIKYGVVQLDRLMEDLENWDTMYLAGRFQKPVGLKDTSTLSDGRV